jgi:hypothetical protein
MPQEFTTLHQYRKDLRLVGPVCLYSAQLNGATRAMRVDYGHRRWRVAGEAIEDPGHEVPDIGESGRQARFADRLRPQFIENSHLKECRGRFCICGNHPSSGIADYHAGVRAGGRHEF